MACSVLYSGPYPMPHLITSIEINATPERVWDVLAANDRYDEWNPFIVLSEGALAAGARITNTLVIEGGKPTTFRPRIIALDPGRELRWVGGIPGLFRGEHYFYVTPLIDGRTRVTHGEMFSGALIPFMTKLLARTKDGFLAMNEALKRRCETSGR